MLGRHSTPRRGSPTLQSGAVLHLQHGAPKPGREDGGNSPARSPWRGTSAGPAPTSEEPPHPPDSCSQSDANITTTLFSQHYSVTSMGFFFNSTCPFLLTFLWRYSSLVAQCLMWANNQGRTLGSRVPQPLRVQPTLASQTPSCRLGRSRPARNPSPRPSRCCPTAHASSGTSPDADASFCSFSPSSSSYSPVWAFDRCHSHRYPPISENPYLGKLALEFSRDTGKIIRKQVSKQAIRKTPKILFAYLLQHLPELQFKYFKDLTIRSRQKQMKKFLVVFKYIFCM